MPDNFDEAKAPFNMAINTLERLGRILEEIKTIDSDLTISPAEKQSIIIPKVRHFFAQSSPLLKPEVVSKFKPIVQNLKVNSVANIYIRNGLKKKEGTKLIYNENLDDLILLLLIDLQQELQKEKYFMPPRKDLNRAITEM